MDIATCRYVNDSWSEPLPSFLDSDQTLVLVFAARSYVERPEVLAELAAAFPRSIVMGCSTSGEIDQTEIRDESIAVAAVRFANTRIRYVHTTLESGSDSSVAGEMLAAGLVTDDLRAVVVLSEGLHVNGSSLVRGLNARLPEHVVVTGGLAGDGARFARTWVLAGGVPQTDAIAAVGLYGSSLRVTHGSQGGWDSFGLERKVTASRGNVLLELDGQPALELYKGYLGERAADLPSSALLFPLALRDSMDSANSVVRTVLSVDEAAHSMTFAGDIPTGQYVKLMRANFDRLVLGARGAGHAAIGDHVGPTLSIAISCVGRRLVLGERAEEETEATLDALPPGTTQIGFYSYGEISPHATGRCELHNQTMTLTVLSEAA
ncbi:MAG: FIST N-terminal domain-containing protein [Deltaproteobacteria bacterium]